MQFRAGVRLKPIEEVEAGDLVQARDDGTGVTSLKPVLQLIGNPGKHVIALTFVGTLGVEERMEVTEDHPFMTMTGWQLAAEMPLGAALRTYDGRALSLKSRVDEGKQARTYNFEVAESHTYFVGRSGVWVHNSGPCKISASNAEIHHICTDKNCISHARGNPWTPRFDAIFERAGMSLGDPLNKVLLIGHKGPYPEAYHQAVLDRLTAATHDLDGAAYTHALRAELRAIGKELQTPDSLLNKLATKK